MVERPTAKRIHSEPDRLWRIVTDYPDIFDSLIVPKLNGNDVKFFYDVNTESRVAIKRSSGEQPSRFVIFSQNRPYLGRSRSVLKKRNVFVWKWL